jgi:hypothetical protein
MVDDGLLVPRGDGTAMRFVGSQVLAMRNIGG